MRVLHVIHAAYPEAEGGTQLYLRDLVGAQVERGDDVVLLTGSMQVWDEVGVERLELNGVPAYRVHRDDWFFDHYAKAYHPAVERLVADVLRAQRPDVVHLHHWLMLTCNVVAIAHALDIPVVITLHDAYVSCPRCYRVRPERASPAGAEHCTRALSVESCQHCVPRYGHETDAEVRTGIELFARQYRGELGLARSVLVPSRASAELVAAATGVAQERIEVLPLGYRGRGVGIERAAAKAPFGFAHWGNLEEPKGTHVLLEACRHLAETADPETFEVHLFGVARPGHFDERLRELARGLPVAWSSECDLHRVAASGARIGVFPSLCFETFSFVLEECFELGLPCIVSDVGAMRERAGGAALTVPPGDAAALAAAMRRVLDDRELTASLATRLPARAPTPAAHAAALADVYARAARSPRRSDGRAVSTAEWTEFLLGQRESALARLHDGRGPR